MNSLFQTLYLTPQFREFIFSLPLEYGPDQEGQGDKAKSTLKVGKRKFSVLRAFQNLFTQMQACDFRATSTKEVTTSFGWNDDNNEVGQQHDVGELNNILVEALEKCFQGTQHEQTVSDLFFGVQNAYVTCD